MTEPATAEPVFKAEITGKETIADKVCLLTLRPYGGVPAWTPGAHVDLLLSPGLVRQYSLCGDPADREHLRVAVLGQPDGRGGSLHVHSRLEVGDTLELRGPRNHFALVDAPAYLFVAGGIGITPLLPMVREVETRGLPWRLLYGGRTMASMAFTAELTELGGDRVVLRPQDVRGLLDLPTALSPTPEGAAVYACGPEPLLTALDQAREDFPLLSLRTERFSPREPQAKGPDEAFEVELAQSGRTVEVCAQETLLDALERAGVAPASSCREGTCGTCEIAVLSGTPDHRDSLLTEDERAAGNVLFPCVSRARSPRLVLDL